MEKNKIVSRLMQIGTERAKIKVEESKCLKKIMKLINIFKQLEEEKQLVEADYVRYFLSDPVDYEGDLTDVMLLNICSEISLTEQDQHILCQSKEQCSNISLTSKQSGPDTGIFFEEVKCSLETLSIQKEIEPEFFTNEKPK